MDPERSLGHDRQIRGGEDGDDARGLQCFRGVHPLDVRVWLGAEDKP
jgi:hypothetical protein